MGGMFGESKFDVLNLVPKDLTPKTMLVKLPVTGDQVRQKIAEGGFTYPVIFKPDLGERGWMVKKIKGPGDIGPYLKQIKLDFLIQAYVDLPLEFGVFYVRYPSLSRGAVTSIVGKEMLSVCGDGMKTLEELILEKDRARLQWNTLKVIYEATVQSIIPPGERVELVSIGNHCLGTMFLNQNHLINEKLSASFDRISQQIPGFFFGRFDLRVASIEDLTEGKVQVMELNGCGAEPAHIYQPGFPFLKALKVLFQHWHDIYRVSRENHERGVAYISFKEAKTAYNNFKTLTAP